MSYCTVCGNGTDQFDPSRISGDRCDGCGRPKQTPGWLENLFSTKPAPVEPPAAGEVDLDAIEAALTVADRKTDIFDAAWAALRRLRSLTPPSPVPAEGA